MPSDQAKLEPNKRKSMKTDKAVLALPRGAAKQVGTALSSVTVASINGFLANPDAIRLPEYERAMTTDETISSALDFTVLSLVASMGEYRHRRPEITKFVLENLAQMEGNYRQAVAELSLSALWSGFGHSEQVWTVDGRHLWLERLANYHPSTLYIATDINGYLRDGGEPMAPGAQPPGIYQLTPLKGYGTYMNIPLNKSVLITHRKRHGNYYGESAIRRIYKNWKFKDPGLEMWAVALDRYGTPVVYALVPNAQTGRMMIDAGADDGRRMERMSDAAAAAIAGISTGTGLVLENPDPNNPVKLDTLTTGNNYGTSFMDFIAYHDRAIYRGLLIPQTIFNDSRSGGINNTSKTHFEVYKQMIRSLYMAFVEPFVEQCIGRLVRYNFNETDPGEIPMVPFDPAAADLLATMLDKMVNIGGLNPADLRDLNYMRSLVGAPNADKPIVDDIAFIVPDMRLERQNKVEIAGERTAGARYTADKRAEVEHKKIETSSKTQRESLKLQREQLEHQKSKDQQDLKIKSKQADQQHEANLLQIQEKGKTDRTIAKHAPGILAAGNAQAAAKPGGAKPAPKKKPQA